MFQALGKKPGIRRPELRRRETNSQTIIAVNNYRTSDIIHRCPAYQIHLPPKTRFGDPKNPLQANAGKFREIQGFLSNNIEMPRKRPIQGIPGNSFWGSQTGIFGMIFLGRWQRPKLICWARGRHYEFRRIMWCNVIVFGPMVIKVVWGCQGSVVSLWGCKTPAQY